MLHPVLSLVSIAVMSLTFALAENPNSPPPKLPALPAKAPAAKPAKPSAKSQTPPAQNRAVHERKQAFRAMKPRAAAAKKHEPIVSKHAQQLKDRIAAARAKFPAEQEAGKGPQGGPVGRLESGRAETRDCGRRR